MPRRLIEEAFPLEKVSTDSKHEKNVHHGHISNLHIWPARRPLAACRAVTLATLLPEPEDAPEPLKAEYTRLSGSSLPDDQRKYLCDLIAALTRWGDENGHAEWHEKDQKGRWLNKLRIARELIQTAYNGKPPKVLDLFAGGGAIPLEAMRLGCEAIANDYNPVAWFILKCTLEYPQRLAGKTHQLPKLNLSEPPELKNGDLVDHVRLWGQWVLENARNELKHFYPTIDDKPTVAYLWTRTIPCQDPSCNGQIPLLKTLYLSKKAEKTLPDTPENRARPDFLRTKETRNQKKVVINAKRALKLSTHPETKRVQFEIYAPKNVDDLGTPTMSGRGAAATCPFCSAPQPGDHIKRCGHIGKLKAQMTAVVYQETYGKEYRTPTQEEINAAEIPPETLAAIEAQIPHGIPDEPMPSPKTLGFSIPLYGFKQWSQLFRDRQLLALMTFVKWTLTSCKEMKKIGYPTPWIEAVWAYLAVLVNRIADYNSTICTWHNTSEAVRSTFMRFAMPIVWDFAELNPFSQLAGSYSAHIGSVTRFLENMLATKLTSTPDINQQSSRCQVSQKVSAIITDPPYYDAIPYADLSDFFYVWLRRSIGEQFPDIFADTLTPKSDELVQHSDHFDGDNKAAKKFYESGMAATFSAARNALVDTGRIVIVFAHKSPDAWETLVTAMIEAGLVVTASWPIDTELKNSLSSQRKASLATSLWLVCRKRPADAKVGWYNQVTRAMKARITERLRDFWDMGIRGPDFVWAAIGPALESYSAHTEVRRATGNRFTVTEFLTEVRRRVTNFALGQILNLQNTEALDAWTSYYLMHRNHFGTADAPVGECILLAQGYGVSLDELRNRRDGFLKKVASGNALKLHGYTERDATRVGYTHTLGQVPIIDVIHRLMLLWDANERAELNDYFIDSGLAESQVFKPVVQALIEMNPEGSNERALLETLLNYKPSARIGTDWTHISKTTDTDQQQSLFDIESLSRKQSTDRK